MTEHPNIALIGMPGPGKSAAGRLLAEMYGERFALYAARADITIRTDDMTLEQVCE